ncbi:hypothetical protein BN8_05332 [Fibrisoma limi BUZ 3]|uniref:DUF3052 domain-containing protein n=1 Tax=Fibrisoma limi BUZ 3 TaxID=1185876 RepID=I2GQ49_9BACT|nr:hypothetical protein [Fibrisoma limi]CCH56027.1 hypothetical protein BN8_05332 [Fibrisoma limi BUZ 3]
MNAVFQKLNLKNQTEVAVFNAPDEFLPVLEDVKPMVSICNDPEQIQEGQFMLAFVKTQKQLDELVPVLAERLQGDGLLWFAYPKGSSKKHKCDFNRDTGWRELGKLGFEGVRQVAIDEDWSAVRFRRVAYIKKMTRQDSRALSEQGKIKTKPTGTTAP